MNYDRLKAEEDLYKVDVGDMEVTPEMLDAIRDDLFNEEIIGDRIPAERINYKFDEDRYLAEITDYINKTYDQHYSRDKFQATEFIYDGGHGTGFNIGNVLKYAQRYGKKGSHDDARKDLMKVIHYAILQLHVHDNEG